MTQAQTPVSRPQAPAASERGPAACGTLLTRLNALMQLYKDAAAAGLEGQPLEVAIEKARDEAMAGNKEATVRLIGYMSLVQAREGSYPIQVVRQVCTLARRGGLALHVATCAYFHVLNPRGEAKAKAAAARKVIAQFEAGDEKPADLAEHVAVLKACLPDRR